MPQKLTKVQRTVLQAMSDAPGITRIETGHKQTTCTEQANGELIVRCQTLVPYFLKVHGYIEQAPGIAQWCLTSKGQTKVDSLRGHRP